MIQEIKTYGYEFKNIVVNTLLGVPDDTFSVPVELQTIPFFAIKNGDLWRWNTSSFIWEMVTAGGSGNTIYTGNGTIADAVRTISLNANTLNVDSPLGTNLSVAQQQTIIAGYDATNGGNSATVAAGTNDSIGTVDIRASFDAVSTQCHIQLSAVSGNAFIDYVAGNHNFDGVLRIIDLAGNGNGFVSIDNNGFIGFGNPSTGYTVVPVSSSPYNAAQTSGDIILLVDATTGNIIINLPTAVGNTAKFTIKKVDGSSNTVTIEGNTTETIDGDLNKEIDFQWTSATIISDNLNWLIV